MINYIITFFILAVLAGILGFGALAGTFAEVAKFLSVLFVSLFAIGLIYSLVSGRKSKLIDLE
jgi:uncharacterized membrane protein YtjA (UPF0391 family)